MIAALLLASVLTGRWAPIRYQWFSAAETLQVEMMDPRERVWKWRTVYQGKPGLRYGIPEYFYRTRACRAFPLFEPEYCEGWVEQRLSCIVVPGAPPTGGCPTDLFPTE